MICKLIRYKPYIGVELVEKGSFYRDLAGALGHEGALVAVTFSY